MSKYKIRRKLGVSIAIVATFFLSAVGHGYAKENAVYGESAPKVMVKVDDLDGYMNFNSERIREDLLYSAFHRAANKKDWLGDYAFEYNKSSFMEGVGEIRFGIISWERRRSGIYECVIRADYVDADGKKTNLGVFSGTKLSMAMTNPFSVNDDYRDAAQEAFKQALRKLGKEMLTA